MKGIILHIQEKPQTVNTLMLLNKSEKLQPKASSSASSHPMTFQHTLKSSRSLQGSNALTSQCVLCSNRVPIVWSIHCWREEAGLQRSRVNGIFCICGALEKRGKRRGWKSYCLLSAFRWNQKLLINTTATWCTVNMDHSLFCGLESDHTSNLSPITQRHSESCLWCFKFLQLLFSL